MPGAIPVSTTTAALSASTVGPAKIAELKLQTFASLESLRTKSADEVPSDKLVIIDAAVVPFFANVLPLASSSFARHGFINGASTKITPDLVPNSQYRIDGAS